MNKTRFKAPWRRFKQALKGWRQRVHEYSQRCIQSGFIPLTFRPAQFLGRLFARFLVFLQLGKIRVMGRRNLQIPGRFVFCPNHSSMFDAPVMYSILNRPEDVRYMTAFEEMRGLWGLKAILMGAMGSFPVDRSRGKSVIEPAIEVLVRGQSLTIFPEGRVSETEECQPFKNGAAIIASEALKRLGKDERIGIIPVHIHYHRRHNPTARTNFLKMGFKWRGGVTVTVGCPIYLDERANASPEELMSEVRSVICKVQSGRKKVCPCAA